MLQLLLHTWAAVPVVRLGGGGGGGGGVPGGMANGVGDGGAGDHNVCATNLVPYYRRKSNFVQLPVDLANCFSV